MSPSPRPQKTAFATSWDDRSLRLDQLLVHHLGLSRRQARLRIAAGEITVNGRPARIVARRVGAGVQVGHSPGGGPPDAPGQAHALPRVLALGPLAVAVDKPSGLLAECDRFGAPALETWLPAWLARRGERPDVFLVHRLDAATSGVMVVARRPRAARLLGQAFAERRVDKRYLALVAGRLRRAAWVDAPVGRVAGTRHGVVASGRPARSHVLPLAASATATWVELRPATGRTHQLRVHMRHLGHPIVGDRLYGGPLRAPSGAVVPRLMLHAAHLVLPDPDGGPEPWQIAAPPPPVMAWARAAFAVEANP